MIRAARVLVLSVALVATLTACDPGGDVGPTPTPTTSASSTASGTPTASGSPSSAPVTAPPCTRDSLGSEFAFTDGSAGHLHGILTLRNQGAAACSLSGYPTLYFGYPGIAVTLGAEATHDPDDPGTPLDVAPGGSAIANVTIVQAGNVDGCDPITADSLVYAAPGVAFDVETTAQRVTLPETAACTNEDLSLLTVGGFAAG